MSNVSQVPESTAGKMVHQHDAMHELNSPYPLSTTEAKH